MLMSLLGRQIFLTLFDLFTSCQSLFPARLGREKFKDRVFSSSDIQFELLGISLYALPLSYIVAFAIASLAPISILLRIDVSPA